MEATWECLQGSLRGRHLGRSRPIFLQNFGLRLLEFGPSLALPKVPVGVCPCPSQALVHRWPILAQGWIGVWFTFHKRCGSVLVTTVRL